jgi:hypothetical protein
MAVPFPYVLVDSMAICYSPIICLYGCFVRLMDICSHPGVSFNAQFSFSSLTILARRLCPNREIPSWFLCINMSPGCSSTKRYAHRVPSDQAENSQLKDDVQEKDHLLWPDLNPRHKWLTSSFFWFYTSMISKLVGYFFCFHYVLPSPGL